MRKNAVFLVNIAVLLFGLAGLFAKWIHLPAVGITFGRVLFSSAALGIYILIRKQSIRIASGRDLLLLLCAGAILALHWWSFLRSVQLSSVAVGTITFSSFPLFVTFLEPLLFRQKLKLRSVVIAVVILIGVLITVPEFSLEDRMFIGILVGMASALAYAILTVMNKSLSAKYGGTVTAFYEQTTAALVLFPFVFGSGIRPSVPDLALLLFLGVITTALAHTLFIGSLRSIPAQLAGICSSMETVYGILFAWILLGEIPSVRQITGAAVIAAAVIFAQKQTDQPEIPASRTVRTDGQNTGDPQISSSCGDTAGSGFIPGKGKAMLCAIARIDTQSRDRLLALQKISERFGAAVRDLYGHITLATYIGEEEGSFIASCKEILSARAPFSVYYEKVEVLGATSIIVASPRNENALFDIHHDIAMRWGPYLDEWTDSDLWKPHTTLLYDPQADLQAIAEAMRKEFVPFYAQVNGIEFSRVTENGYTIVDSVDLLQR